MHLNKLVKTARTKRGLTQAQVAKSLGFGSPQFVSNWERNAATPGRTHFRKLARILEVPTQALISAAVRDYRDELTRTV